MNKMQGLFIVTIVLVMASFILIKDAEAQSDVYELELKRWGVYNDNTHPIETTNGMII